MQFAVNRTKNKWKEEKENKRKTKQKKNGENIMKQNEIKMIEKK